MKVSICIPHFNQHEYLERAVESALRQACDGIELEIVVCDNASPNCCQEALARCEGMDDRVRVIRNTYNIGMVANWNKTVRESTGDIICLLSADDELLPGAVEKVCHEFEADPEVVLVYGGSKVVVGSETQKRLGRRFPGPVERNYERQIFRPPSFLEVNISKPQIQLCSAFFKRAAYEIVGGFKGEAGTQADWLFWGELGAIGTVVRLDATLGLYRVHDRSQSFESALSFKWILYHYCAEDYLLRLLRNVEPQGADSSSFLNARAREASLSSIKNCLQSPRRRFALRQMLLVYSLWPSTRMFIFGCAVALLSFMPSRIVACLRWLARSIKGMKRKRAEIKT
ncbi:MAG TPA: glycosyltransferase [Syntrophomonadaceae bacterium]|nr:glycosyltransferase [Syntrophomonadaceae bacterium]